jgi:hypothetical protein
MSEEEEQDDEIQCSTGHSSLRAGSRYLDSGDESVFSALILN